jgi:hypothetical protein
MAHCGGDLADGARGPVGSIGPDSPITVPASIGVAGLQSLIDSYGNAQGLTIGITTVVGKGRVDFGTAKVEIATSLETNADATGGVAILNLMGASKSLFKIIQTGYTT